MTEYYTVEFDSREIEAAKDYAEAHARIDDRTKDPENVLANKTAARLSEIAAIAALKSRGYAPTWKAEGDTTGSEAPYDIEVAGERVDVKCRHSADDGATANLMPSKSVRQREGDTHDSYIMVWVAPDFSEARVYGYASVEFFQREASVFYGVSPPAERLRRDDLRALKYVGDDDVTPKAKATKYGEKV